MRTSRTACREIRDAAGGPPEAYASVLERTLAACVVDPAADHLDVLDLHSELAGTHDRQGRVKDVLRHADARVEQA